MVRTDIHLDAENECIVLRSVDQNGNVINTLPQVRIKLEDLQYADQVGGRAIEAVFRRLHFTNPISGSKQRCHGLFTIPEDDSVDDGHSDAAQDLYLGGSGGGGDILCEITELFSGVNNPLDYIGVKLKGPQNTDGFDASGYKGAQFEVAKSLVSRMSATGVGTLTFTDDNHRVSDDGSGTTATNPEAQEMFPPFGIGNLITIRAINYSFVVGSGGTDLKWIESSTAREWTAPTKKTYIDGTPVSA